MKGKSNWKNRVSIGLWRWGPALLMMLLIFLASSIPGDRMPNAGQWDFSVKKGGHMTGYALLAVSLMVGQQKNTPRAVWIALGVVLIYALSDEYHQSFVPGRNSALLDVGIDVIGAGVGVMVWSLVRRRHRSELN